MSEIYKVVGDGWETKELTKTMAELVYREVRGLKEMQRKDKKKGWVKVERKD
jgi:hypothetical protein